MADNLKNKSQKDDSDSFCLKQINNMGPVFNRTIVVTDSFAQRKRLFLDITPQKNNNKKKNPQQKTKKKKNKTTKTKKKQQTLKPTKTKIKSKNKIKQNKTK